MQHKVCFFNQSSVHYRKNIFTYKYPQSSGRNVRYRNTDVMNLYLGLTRFKRSQLSNLRIALWYVRNVFETIYRLSYEDGMITFI